MKGTTWIFERFSLQDCLKCVIFFAKISLLETSKNNFQNSLQDHPPEYLQIYFNFQCRLFKELVQYFPRTYLRGFLKIFQSFVSKPIKDFLLRPSGINFKGFSRSSTRIFIYLVVSVDFSKNFEGHTKVDFSKIFQDLKKCIFSTIFIDFIRPHSVDFSNTSKWIYQRVLEDF